MDRFDQGTLLEWLALHDAPDEVIAAVGGGLHALGPDSLPPEGIYLVLCGALAQVTEPYVTEQRLDALKALATRLGYNESHFEGLLSYTLRIKERRLRAYAVLGLSLDATPHEIKQVHRQLAKTFHPDRARALGQRELDRATRMLARLNEARALLLQSVDGVSLHGEDDLSLDEFRFEDGDDVPLWREPDEPVLQLTPEETRALETSALETSVLDTSVLDTSVLDASVLPILPDLPTSDDAPTEEYTVMEDDFTELWDEEEEKKEKEEEKEETARAQGPSVKFVTTGR